MDICRSSRAPKMLLSPPPLNDGALILQGGQVGSDLVLSTGDRSSSQKIPALPAHTAHKTLGHYKDPSGNQSKQYEKLKAKSDKAGSFVQCSPLDRSEAWTYYFSFSSQAYATHFQIVSSRSRNWKNYKEKPFVQSSLNVDITGTPSEQFSMVRRPLGEHL
jgi:hypothetical protein